MHRFLIASLLALAAIPAVAFGAAKPGTYAGTSSGKYIQVGQAQEPTDRGKVSFTVRSGKVVNFKVRGQLFQCGPPNVVPVTVKTIKLNSSGKGSANYRNPNIGTLKVTIKVTSTGKASGTVRKPPSAVGLCDSGYPVRFTAKRR
jgi:long-subunit fatty acid transport protein